MPELLSFWGGWARVVCPLFTCLIRTYGTKYKHLHAWIIFPGLSRNKIYIFFIIRFIQCVINTILSNFCPPLAVMILSLDYRTFMKFWHPVSAYLVKSFHLRGYFQGTKAVFSNLTLPTLTYDKPHVCVFVLLLQTIFQLESYMLVLSWAVLRAVW